MVMCGKPTAFGGGVPLPTVGGSRADTALPTKPAMPNECVHPATFLESELGNNPCRVSGASPCLPCNSPPKLLHSAKGVHRTQRLSPLRRVLLALGIVKPERPLCLQGVLVICRRRCCRDCRDGARSAVTPCHAPGHRPGSPQQSTACPCHACATPYPPPGPRACSPQPSCCREALSTAGASRALGDGPDLLCGCFVPDHLRPSVFNVFDRRREWPDIAMMQRPARTAFTRAHVGAKLRLPVPRREAIPWSASPRSGARAGGLGGLPSSHAPCSSQTAGPLPLSQAIKRTTAAYQSDCSLASWYRQAGVRSAAFNEALPARAPGWASWSAALPLLVIHPWLL